MANYKSTPTPKDPALPQGMQGGQGDQGSGDAERPITIEPQNFDVMFINKEMKDVLKAVNGDQD